MKRLKTRVVWGFNPITRVVKSKKIYSRTKAKKQVRNELLG